MLIIKNKKMLKNEINENEALSIARVSGWADFLTINLIRWN